LVWIASQTEQFQHSYPFYKLNFPSASIKHLLVWEAFYFLQFVGLEFFFRGFMVHALKKRFGYYSIFIMMIPYCMIHFGKPLPETIGAIFAGIVLALQFVGFFLAMRMTTVAAGTALVALQPIFAALFLKLMGGDIPSRAWMGMFVSFGGVLLISGVDLQISFRAFLGDIAAIISAALAAVNMLVGSKAQQTLETSTYTAICYFFCAVTALPMALIAGNQIFNFEAREWWILLGLIFGAQFLGHTMFNSVLKRVSPAVVSLIVFFEVPVSAVLAMWWMDQRPPLGVIPGIALILFGCALVVLRTRPTTSQSKETIE
jgi:drug/metabolite transporter (DMT)-like permease